MARGGDDTLIGLEGDDHLEGGAGADTAAYVYSTNPIAADLRAGTVTGEGTDKLAAVENVTGSGSGDTFAGDAGEQRDRRRRAAQTRSASPPRRR